VQRASHEHCQAGGPLRLASSALARDARPLPPGQLLLSSTGAQERQVWPAGAGGAGEEARRARSRGQRSAAVNYLLLARGPNSQFGAQVSARRLGSGFFWPN